MYVRDTLCRRILFLYSRLALMTVIQSSTDRKMQIMTHAGRYLHSGHFTQTLCHTSPTTTTRITFNPSMQNTNVSQPGFRRTSLWDPQEITEYLKILKYHEKFPISLERWPKLCTARPKLCTAIVLYLSHFRSLPTFLVCKRFHRKGYLKNWKLLRCFSIERLGNTTVYHSTWPTHTNKAGKATFTAHYETHTTYQ
jgi:hypothetical protein